jgi:putative transcription antitermination factor YqgF
MFDLLAIDWGIKFFGFAKSDTTTKLIIPYNKIVPFVDFEKEVDILLQSNQINKILIGSPLNFNYKKTENSIKVEDFTDKLTSKYPSLNIINFSERNTSIRAEQIIEMNNLHKDNVHNLSAYILIQDYYNFYS